jgi:radical SAM-linked protein
MTEGFHPKPRVGFPSALALGVEGMDEVVELELAEELLPNELLDRLQSDNQPGLIILSVSRLPEGFGKAQLKQSDYVINLPPSADLETTQLAIERLKSQETVSVLRKGKTITANVQSQIPELAITQSLLHLSLTASDSASLRPGDVLDLLGIGDSFEQGAMITRTRVTLHREFESDDPNQVALAKVTQSDENAVSEQDDA